MTKISGDVGLRHAQALAQTLRDAMVGNSDICVDVSAVTTADITTVQLLLAARRQAVGAGRQFTLATPPQGALRDLLSQTGFLDQSGRPLTADAAFWSPVAASNKGKAA